MYEWRILTSLNLVCTVKLQILVLYVNFMVSVAKCVIFILSQVLSVHFVSDISILVLVADVMLF